MILIIHAHPYPSRSRICKALLAAIHDLPGIEVRSLYDLYPDFDIDARKEQEALARADLVVWLHPIQWYSVPGLLKHWFDKVLTHGWAYGHDGRALHGKHCLWVASVGGAEHTYAEGHSNLRPFADYSGPVEQTARYCGMRWEMPELVFNAYEISHEKLDEHARLLRERLLAWQKKHAAEAKVKPA
jgi:glutathione-regulated potassium-efflux system ancillary protein KefF